MNQAPYRESPDRMRIRIDDEERLVALRSYKILDTAPEPEYERIVELVHAACRPQWTAITLVDQQRQWFKAVRGFNKTETPRSFSFCSVGIQQMEPLIVENALLDRRFRDSYLVQEMGLRFFAGYPFFSSDGYGLGSVCVIDMQPRTLMRHQLFLIEKARDWVQADLDRRRTLLRWNERAGSATNEERSAATQTQTLKDFVAKKAWTAMMAASAARPTTGT